MDFTHLWVFLNSDFPELNLIFTSKDAAYRYFWNNTNDFCGLVPLSSSPETHFYLEFFSGGNYNVRKTCTLTRTKLHEGA